MEAKAPRSVKPKSKRRAHLPKQPFQNIAISLSGGGFRASCIHLGVLAYLSSRKINGVSLLERVRILTSVSGGTFVGVKYAAHIKKGGTFAECYKILVDFMTRKDLVEDALEFLAEDKNWENGRQRSLINAFASIYHRDFESAHFGLFWNQTPEIHLREIMFNATEFHFAMPFYFQKTETTTGNVEFIGNRKIQLPSELAREIRLADIIAASSCVPFGFEPINFPDDFIHADSVELRKKELYPQMATDGERIHYPIGLMDGGVDDNQGMDAILNAEERMKHYEEKSFGYRSHDKKSVDLYIVSDGTNPYMERYVRSRREKMSFIGKFSFSSTRAFGITSFIVGSALLYGAFLSGMKFMVILLTMAGTLGMLLALALLIFSRGFTGLFRRLGVPSFFIRRVRHVDRLKFATLNNMLVDRRNSVVQMITKVFIKQMRWVGLERVFGDAGWKPRVVLNAVVELTREEVAKRKIKYPYFSEDILEPGELIMDVSARALRKGTTLWFTEEELKGDKNMPESIIACGQFTMCFNLLEYYEKFLKNPKYRRDYDKYSDEQKHMLEELHTAMMDDWKKFKEDPYWMVKQFKSQLWTQGR